MYLGYMGFFGGVGMILFWGAFIWLVIWLIKQSNDGNLTRNTGEKPIDIAKKRFAKGEITKKQLEEIKKELM